MIGTYDRLKLFTSGLRRKARNGEGGKEEGKEGRKEERREGETGLKREKSPL